MTIFGRTHVTKGRAPEEPSARSCPDGLWGPPPLILCLIEEAEDWRVGEGTDQGHTGSNWAQELGLSSVLVMSSQKLGLSQPLRGNNNSMSLACAENQVQQLKHLQCFARCPEQQ